MAITIDPVVRIELLPSGIVEFLESRTGPILTSTRKTTELRRSRGSAETGVPDNVLWFSWENSGKADVVFSVQALEQIVTPGPVIQSYTPIDNNDPESLLARLDEVYQYLITYVFKGCCDDGEPIPGPYICHTYAEWEVLRLAGELPEGLWVCVTDIPSQPGAIFSLFCQEVDAFALGGFGTFLNADWQGVGDYSGVVGLTGVAFTSNIGQWYVGLEGSASDGDVVIWNCLHFQVIDDSAFNGTDPTVNTTAYAALPITTADMGYVSEVDNIEFDFVADWLQYWADKRGNTYRYSQSVDAVFSLGFTAINLFQKGRNLWSGNNIYEAKISIINARGAFTDNTCSPQSYVENITEVTAMNVRANYFNARSHASGVIMQNSASFSNNVFMADSRLEDTQLNRNFTNNTIHSEAIVKDCVFQSLGDFTHNEINPGIRLENKTIEDEFQSHTIGCDMIFLETISVSQNNITHIPGQSNDFRPLDVTGGGAIDIGSNAELVGIYNCSSSNAAETITQFDNPPLLFPFTIKPDAGLIITIAFTPIGSLAANYEIVDATSTLVLDGDNGDSATFEIQTIGGFDVLVLTQAVQNL